MKPWILAGVWVALPLSLAVASTPSAWTLRAAAGASHPMLVSTEGAGAPAWGAEVSATVGRDVSPSVTLIAEVAHDQLGTLGAGTTIPEVSFKGATPYGLTTAQLGFEAHTPDRPGGRSAYAGASGGVSRLRRGLTRWSDMNSGPYTLGGGTHTQPVVAAVAGFRVPTGFACGDLDVRWTSRWIESSAGALRTDALQAGLRLRL